MSDIVPYLIRPNTLTEAMELAKMIAQSNFCPKDMRGKPGDVILAMQMGSEVGLSPIQALQNIAVINSRPCLWGDGALGVVQCHRTYEYHREWMEGEISMNNRTAYTLVKRQGAPEYTKSFSMDDAKKANLWGKSGPWSQYPDRMLQMRARAFAIRDQFADALKGIQIREEVMDYNNDSMKKLPEPLVPSNEELLKMIETDRMQIKQDILAAHDRDSLRVAFEKAVELHLKRADIMQDIIFLKDIRKAEIEDLERDAQEKVDAIFVPSTKEANQ